MKKIITAGFNNGSVIQFFIFEIDAFFKKVHTGYATNIPLGIYNFSFKIKPIKESTKFPPAESPAKTIFLGLIFKYLWILVSKNL